MTVVVLQHHHLQHQPHGHQDLDPIAILPHLHAARDAHPSICGPGYRQRMGYNNAVHVDILLRPNQRVLECSRAAQRRQVYPSYSVSLVLTSTSSLNPAITRLKNRSGISLQY
jgi:hypothetical protein